jgi:heme-degrading monooxygenase HmoA
VYIRISRASFDPSREEEVIDLGHSAMAAAAQALPGFQSSERAIDGRAGRLVIITRWDTEEHARFARDQLGSVLAQTEALGVHLEPADVYEIVAEA